MLRTAAHFPSFILREVLVGLYSGFQKFCQACAIDKDEWSQSLSINRIRQVASLLSSDAGVGMQAVDVFIEDLIHDIRAFPVWSEDRRHLVGG